MLCLVDECPFDNAGLESLLHCWIYTEDRLTTGLCTKLTDVDGEKMYKPPPLIYNPSGMTHFDINMSQCWWNDLLSTNINVTQH